MGAMSNVYTCHLPVNAEWKHGLGKLNRLSPLGPEFGIRMLLYPWFRVVGGFGYKIDMR